MKVELKLPFMKTLFCALLLGVCMHSAWAFTLEDLDKQLRQTPVVRGEFIQEKYLRGLEEPLRATGTFTLATGHGLLWNLGAPVTRSLRITPRGIAYYVVEAGGSGENARWVVDSSRGQQSRTFRLFLSVLNGDTAELKKQFHLTLAGVEDEWRLTLTPNSSLLRQIFSRIEIMGGAEVRRIELHETQGDTSVVEFNEVIPDVKLTAQEARAFEN